MKKLSAYQGKKDEADLSQIDRLEQLLLDGMPHRVDEIQRVVYGSDHLGVARIGARIFDLQKRGFEIVSFRDEKIKTLWWYKIVKSTAENKRSKLSFDTERRAEIARNMVSITPEVQKERTLFG